MTIFDHNKGAIVDHMNRLMKCNDIMIIDQIIWTIANACGEGGHEMSVRNFVLKKMNVVNCLQRVIVEAIDCKTILKQGFLKTMVWSIANLV